jgi:hypothetical protein
VLVSGVVVLALAAIELVWLVVVEGQDVVAAISTVYYVLAKTTSSYPVIAIAPVDDIIAKLAKPGHPIVVARPSVDDVVAISSVDGVFTAKAAYDVLAVRTEQLVWSIGAQEQAPAGTTREVVRGIGVGFHRTRGTLTIVRLRPLASVFFGCFSGSVSLLFIGGFDVSLLLLGSFRTRPRTANHQKKKGAPDQEGHHHSYEMPSANYGAPAFYYLRLRIM